MRSLKVLISLLLAFSGMLAFGCEEQYNQSIRQERERKSNRKVQFLSELTRQAQNIELAFEFAQNIDNIKSRQSAPKASSIDSLVALAMIDLAGVDLHHNIFLKIHADDDQLWNKAQRKLDNIIMRVELSYQGRVNGEQVYQVIADNFAQLCTTEAMGTQEIADFVLTTIWQSRQ